MAKCFKKCASALAMKRTQKPRGKKGQIHKCRTCNAIGHRTGPLCPLYQEKRSQKKLTKRQKESLARKPPYFHTHPSTRQAGGKHRSALEALKQVSYKDVIVNDRVAWLRLRTFGLLPTMDPRRRKCHACGSKVMKWKDGSQGVGLRCRKKQCQKVITRTAFTPLHWKKALTPASFLQLAYLYSLGLRVDQAMHIAGFMYKTVEAVFRDFNVVAAWNEAQAGKTAVFQHGEVEVDAAKFGVLKKNEDRSIHTGRFLAVAAREDAKKVLIPLPDRSAPRARNPGPESFEEVHPHLSRIMADGAIQVSDSAKAYEKSAKISRRPAVKVNHTQGQFSKFDKLPKADMTPKMRKVAESRASSSRGSMRMTVCTNLVEGHIGNTKVKMCKRGVLGGGAARNAKLNVMAVAWMAKEPGIMNLGKAMQRFWSDRLDSVDPRNFFSPSCLDE